jgi:TATA-binding protein-associated factor Taf7
MNPAIIFSLMGQSKKERPGMLNDDDEDHEEDGGDEGEEDNSEEISEAIEEIEQSLEELEELIAEHNNPGRQEKLTESIPRIQEILDIMKKQLKARG